MPNESPIRRQPHLSPSTYMMNRVPVEIKRMIAFELRNSDENPHGPRHIKRFRLVNKQFSVIGAEYLLREIHLTFQPKSFERLRTISRRPGYIQNVTRLRYEPDAIETTRKNEQGFIEQGFETYFNSIKRPPTQSQGEAVSYSEQLFDREPEEVKVAARLALHKNYNAYRAVNSDQMTIRHQIDAYNSALLVQAIAQLPHLTEIIVNFEDGVVPHTKAFNRAYKDTFILPGRVNVHRCPYGMMQLYSVLCGVASAGIKFKTLKCDKIDWKLLQMEETKMHTIKRALKYLENLHLMFYVREKYFDAPKFVSELRDCGIFLANYGMCEFLSAAEGLQTLSLYSDRSGGSDLQYLVGTTTWACLRVIALDRIYATESTLVGFLQRHAGTLKELELNNIDLIRGCWKSALPGIRNAVRLEELRAVGVWKSPSPVIFYSAWIVDTSKNSQNLQESTLPRPYKLGMAVNRYIREGGECPLWDGDTYPTLAGFS